MKTIRLQLFSFFKLFFLISLKALSQQPSEKFLLVVKEGYNLEKQFKEKEALIKFREANVLSPNDLPVLYKCSELCSRIGNRESNNTLRDKYYNSALAFAKQALMLYPQSDEANLAMSIAMGRIALTKSGKEKISSVKEIKTFAENAISLNSNNYKAWHVLGKWYYEVSNLNFFEKAAIKMIYGGLPDASFAKSIMAFEKARSLSKNFCLNHLELAKAYHRNNNNPKAVIIIQELLKMSNFTEDDVYIKSTAEKLLKDWQ